MYDIGIIGAGPSGYAAAIRGAQKGLQVILFEKNLIGGTCLNKGCIPTKTILHSCSIYSELKNSSKYGIVSENISFNFPKIQERQRVVSQKIRKSLTSLIKSYGITIIEEEAEIKSEYIITTCSNNYEVKNIIIATGSKPNKISFKGKYSDDYILTSDDILNLDKLPESVLIVGSGAIGIEWARILSCLGVKVTITEIMNQIIPSSDFEVSERVQRLLKRNKIDFYTSTTIESIENKIIKLSNGKEIEVEKVLLAAGRTLEKTIGEFSNKLEFNKYINTDCNFRTNLENIYAIGDINGQSMLAHSAMKQAEAVIDYITDGKNCNFNKNLVPSIIYGTPEIASIGFTEQELQKNGILYKKSIFPVSALGKAHADDKTDGFIKILVSEDEYIIGAHIISEEAGSLIEQIAIAMTNKLSYKNLENVVYAHPTYSEGIFESILGLDNIAIHIPQNNKGNEL